jgi:hypothetical protein
MNCTVIYRFPLVFQAVNMCKGTYRDDSLTNKGPQNGDTMTPHGQGSGHTSQSQSKTTQPEEPQPRSIMPYSLIGRKAFTRCYKFHGSESRVCLRLIIAAYFHAVRQQNL